MERGTKWGIFVLFFIGIWLSLSVSLAAEPKTVRVGCMAESSFIRQYANGSYYGYGVEYLEKIAEYTGWEYEYVQGDFAGLWEMLEKGEIDLLCVLQRTEEREKTFLFSECPAGWEYSSLYVREEDSIDYEDFEAFEGMRIGFLEGFQSNLDFIGYAGRSGFQYIACSYQTAEEMNAALERGEVDAVTRTSLLLDRGQRLVARYAAAPFYFSSGKQNAELIAEINAAQRQIRLETPYFEEELQEKYDPDLADHTLTLAEGEYVQNAPVIRVGYSGDLDPVSYEQDGEMMGVSREMFRHISDKTGLQFSFLQYNTPGAAMNAAISGNVDMVACIETRNLNVQELSLTEPYFEVPLVMVAKNDTDMEGTIRIALRGADRELEDYIARVFEEYELCYYQTPDECLDAVWHGDAEFALENSFLVSSATRKSRYAGLQVNMVVDYNTRICIGVNREKDDLLLGILNKTLQSVTNSGRTQMVAHALAKKRTELSWAEMLADHMDELIIVFLCGAIVFLIIGRRVKQKKERILEQMAYYDELTGMRKQEKFQLDLERALRTNPQRKYALLYLNIDRFQYLNTVLRREKSDEMIDLLGRLINRSLWQGELSGRLYADHFILLYEYRGRSELLERFEKLQHSLWESMSEREVSYKVVLHAGIYLVEGAEERCEDLVYRAMLANQMCQGGIESYFFDEYLEEKLHKELKIESMMEEALGKDEFKTFFQPKYSTDGEGIIGAEALVRWIREDGSIVYPNDFIPLFERNGFILQLDYYMYQKVLEWLRSRLDRQEPVIRISVNLSRLHNGDTNMGMRLSEMAIEYGIPPELIEFELTESAFTDHADNILEQLGYLRERGFSISIDDFGAGYSSLNLLRSVPADILKIDKAFLDETEDSERSSFIIRDIVAMAKDIHMEVICEGVETAEQLAFLREIRCDYAQGYYFSRPLPESRFEEILMERSSV